LLSGIIYVIAVQQDGSQATFQYTGQTPAQVQALQNERVSLGEEASYRIVDKKTYDAAKAPKPISQDRIQAEAVRLQAVSDAKNKNLPTDQRLDALIKAINLQ